MRSCKLVGCTNGDVVILEVVQKEDVQKDCEKWGNSERGELQIASIEWRV